LLAAAARNRDAGGGVISNLTKLFGAAFPAKADRRSILAPLAKAGWPSMPPGRLAEACADCEKNYATDFVRPKEAVQRSIKISLLHCLKT